MNVDFIRFNPLKLTEEEYNIFKSLAEGFDLLICFSDSNSKTECEAVKLTEVKPKIVFADIVNTNNPQELRKKLKKCKSFTGVLSSNINVNREAVMRKKVDTILDSELREIDYSCIKLASEKDVIVEVSLSKFLRTKGLKRMKLFDETKLLIKLLQKFETPFIFTSGAENIFEMRPKKQIYKFFELLSEKNKNALKLSEKFSSKIFRRLTDDKYIMNGVELESNL